MFHQNKKFESYITSTVFANAKSLSFWYWVSGSDAGQLILWKSYPSKYRNVPSRGGSSAPIATITNDQGHGWKQARINLTPDASLMKVGSLPRPKICRWNYIGKMRFVRTALKTILSRLHARRWSTKNKSRWCALRWLG